MKTQLITRATGAPLNRIDGVQKATGAAKYAYEYPVEGVTYVFPVQSTIAKGRAVSIDASPAQPLPGAIAWPRHENPLEARETIAMWSDEGDRQGESVTLYDANQGGNWTRDDVAKAFGLPPERVRVIAPYVGGGFGSKGFPHPHVILTVMAAQATRRPVKLALTRQQMFAVAGYRTPTIHRLRLGADANGRLSALAHDVVEQTNVLYEFSEPAAVATRVMYAAPNRRTTHRLARLDLPVNGALRAPGQCPAMFALESALDELALACGLDPIELRIRNEPAVDPESGRPFSRRGLG